MIFNTATITFQDGTSFEIKIEEIKIENGWASTSSKTRDVDITVKGEAEVPNPDYKEPAPKAPKKPKKQTLIADTWLKDEEDEED